MCKLELDFHTHSDCVITSTCVPHQHIEFPDQAVFKTKHLRLIWYGLQYTILEGLGEENALKQLN